MLPLLPTLSSILPLWDHMSQVDIALPLGCASSEFHDCLTGGPPAFPAVLVLGNTETELQLYFQMQNPRFEYLHHQCADSLSLFLDPFGDLKFYYEISVNHNHEVHSAACRKLRGGYLRDTAWSCNGIKSRVQWLSSGWELWLSIAFKLVSNIPLADGQIWRANFGRTLHIAGERQISSWSPTGLPKLAVAERFGTLKFTGDPCRATVASAC